MKNVGTFSQASQGNLSGVFMVSSRVQRTIACKNCDLSILRRILQKLLVPFLPEIQLSLPSNHVTVQNCLAELIIFSFC